MKSKIFQDENHCYQFDFTDAIWVTDELHDTFQKNKASILSDVDFIAETEMRLYCLNTKMPVYLLPLSQNVSSPQIKKGLTKSHISIMILGFS